MLATMMGGVEVKHTTWISGHKLLTINFLYVLMGDMGDLHPPKDPDRREIALAPLEETELRQTILKRREDSRGGGRAAVGGLVAAVGRRDARAQVAEANLANLDRRCDKQRRRANRSGFLVATRTTCRRSSV